MFQITWIRQITGKVLQYHACIVHDISIQHSRVIRGGDSLCSDGNGYVSYPNVNIVTEMTNLIDASRAYEANVTAFDASKQIAQAGLQIGKS